MSYNPREEITPSYLIPVVLNDPSPGGGPSQHYHPPTDQKSVYWHPSSTSMREAAYPIGGEAQRGRHWKPFQHYKLISGTGSGQQLVLSVITDHSNSDLDTFKVAGAYVGSTGYPGALGEANSGLPSFVDASRANFIVVPNSIDTLCSQALMAMLPRVRNEVSLVNAVLELKDLRSMKNRVLSLRSSMANVTRYLKQVKLNPRSTVRQLLRSWAGDYLQVHFGLLPLISDIVGVYRAVSRTQARINALVNRSGGTRTSHFSRDVQVDPTYLADEFVAAGGEYIPRPDPGGFFEGVYPIAATFTHKREVWNDPVHFHAELKYNYNYTSYQREHARTLGLLDALGLNFNPAIIWNALRWTFVADWVIGVSQWLDSFGVGLMDPMINIQDFLWSIRRSRRIAVTTVASCDTYYGGWGDPTKFIGGIVSRPLVEETAYCRNLSLPSRHSITSSGLTSKEFSLGAALVLVRGKRNR